jgi:hypothetical protein
LEAWLPMQEPEFEFGYVDTQPNLPFCCSFVHVSPGES